MKQEPAWLVLDAILAIHTELVAQHGGVAQLRDKGLLESALAGPRHRFSYGEADIFALAAAYASGITRNHPFIDGNKRAAFMAAYTFLGINGWSLEAPETEVVENVLGLSVRTVSEAEFAGWLRSSCDQSRNADKRSVRPRSRKRPHSKRKKKRN